MLRKWEDICIFLTGAVAYGCLEMLWRGYTHWSMTLAGGFCMLLIHGINRRYGQKPFVVRCLAGCILITVVELGSGLVLNRVLELDVWDYSGVPGNLLGQICPLYTVLWFCISIPACALSTAAEHFFAFLAGRETERKTD